MPTTVNRLTTASKAARRRKATIYRDFPAVADRFARRGKPKTAAADKHFVVVTDPTDIQYHIIKPYIDRFLQSYICRLYLPSTALHATARIRIYLLLCCMQQSSSACAESDVPNTLHQLIRRPIHRDCESTEHIQGPHARSRPAGRVQTEDFGRSQKTRSDDACLDLQFQQQGPSSCNIMTRSTKYSMKLQ